MSQEQTHTLQEILSFCSEYLPALQGRVMPSENQPETLNPVTQPNHASQQMAKIFTGLAQAFPQAGEVYWGCRAWQLWIWQPVFIGVWSASVKQVSIEFSRFIHQMEGLFTAPFFMPEQILLRQTRQQAVFQTASHLKTWIQRELPLIQNHYPMSDKLAGYFLGDGILHALSAAQRLGLMSAEDTLTLEKQWQLALNLRCNGRLRWQNDINEFGVEMVSCCQYYRRSEADYCIGCPKTRKERCFCHG